MKEAEEETHLGLIAAWEGQGELQLKHSAVA